MYMCLEGPRDNYATAAIGGETDCLMVMLITHI